MFQQDEAFNEAVAEWKELATDPGATYDEVLEIGAEEIEPQVTWGTNPSMGSSVYARVPFPEDYEDPGDQKAIKQALAYMGS